MKILLGGVPLGCDNIGDEAILEGIVDILRRNFRSAKITVATARPKLTSDLLGIDAVGLLGFDKNISHKEILDEIKRHDVFIWAGATGLSDYPEVAIKLLHCAQNFGLRTIVWGVGMDSDLNPAFYKIGGKKKLLCKRLTQLLLNTINMESFYESLIERKVRGKISEAISECDLVVVRDPQSKDELLKCDDSLNVEVGADSAIVLSLENNNLPKDISPDVAEALNSDGKKIGVCISAQRQIQDIPNLAAAFDKLIADPTRKMFFIPMNPVTDTILMKEIKAYMKNSERAFMVENCIQPREVMSVASRCDTILSSRLHLLILSANVSTPIVGISRGSKVDNFLAPFGLRASCSVYDTDFTPLLEAVEESLAVGKESFALKKDKVYANLSSRLNLAKLTLKRKLG